MACKQARTCPQARSEWNTKKPRAQCSMWPARIRTRREKIIMVRSNNFWSHYIWTYRLIGCFQSLRAKNRTEPLLCPLWRRRMPKEQTMKTLPVRRKKHWMTGTHSSLRDTTLWDDYRQVQALVYSALPLGGIMYHNKSIQCNAFDEHLTQAGLNQWQNFNDLL